MTLFDYIVFGIIGFFTLLGLVRGFIRELSSILSWVGSAFLTVLLRPVFNEVISQKISNPMLSNAVSSFLVFVVAIVALSILISNIARSINAKFPSSINITLGMAFGFTKGFLISSLIFATVLSMFGDTDDLSSKSGPKWLQDSQTYRPLSFGAYLILPFANSMLGEIKQQYNTPKVEEDETENFDDKIDTLRRYKEDVDTVNKILDKIDTKKDTDNQNSEESGGYKKEQMEKLNRLIDII